jgi:hypothetical protein
MCPRGAEVRGLLYAALWGRKQIVVEMPISVGSCILSVGSVDHADVSSSATDPCIERDCPNLYGIDCLFSRPLPINACEMCDSFMGGDLSPA